MAANVLRTKRAIEVSIYVVRAFVELRETLGAHRELAKRLDALESRLEQKFSSHDQTIAEGCDRVVHMVDGRVDSDRRGSGVGER